MKNTPSPSFSSFRVFLWPIHGFEIKKFLPMFFMLLIICFNHSLLRNLKDTLVVTATSSGAEILPFIKVWALLPTAIFLTFLFTKLSNRFSQERVFTILLSCFLGFFLFFTYVLYPHREAIHPQGWADALQDHLPKGLQGLLAMGRYWSFTLFYVIAECWGNIILAVLFWGFANEITSVEESRRFYGILNVGANAAGAFAGQASNFLMRGQIWDSAFTHVMNVVIVGGIIVMFLFRWLNRNVLVDQKFETLHKRTLSASKSKGSLSKNIRFLTNSPYLFSIAILVLAYNLSINLVEVIWKSQLRELYPDSLRFNTYMNNITSAFCMASTLAAFFLPRLVGRFGWTRTALIPPFVLLTTSLLFFTFFFFQGGLEWLTYSLLGTSALSMSVFFGAFFVVLSKAAKYSVFDATKEMAFIPLDHDTKLRGKAAIDGVGSRLGKSGGSFIHQGLLLIFGTVGTSAPIVALFVLGAGSVWLYATRSLGMQYNTLIGKPPAPKTAEEAVHTAG